MVSPAAVRGSAVSEPATTVGDSARARRPDSPLSGTARRVAVEIAQSADARAIGVTVRHPSRDAGADVGVWPGALARGTGDGLRPTRLFRQRESGHRAGARGGRLRGPC